MHLSKPQYIRGLQCHKSLFNFNIGYQVGDLAKELFPNGVEIEFNSNDFKAMVEKWNVPY